MMKRGSGPSCHWISSLAAVLAAAALASPARAQITLSTGASFGEVVPLGGTPSEIVVDEMRERVYAVNSGANRVTVYDYAGKRVEGHILTGEYPVSAAMSMDSRWLYVTNSGASTLSVVDLDAGRVVQTVSLPAKPEGVAVGFDGRVLITTQGTGTNNAQNTLLVFDRDQEAGQQVFAVPAPPPINTPNPLPAVFIGRPSTAFPGKLIRTPDGQYIVGMVAINQTATNAQTTLFVYETASATVLRNRTVTGQSTVLSISPDGSRFMAGSTLYETATLNVLAQVNSANWPFLVVATGNNPAVQVARNFGGSFFSPDGAYIYSSFNLGANDPNQRPVSNYLLVGSGKNLRSRLGIRLPESILGRIDGPSDGGVLFASSESGLIELPMARLFDYPIIEPEATTVFLANDPCNKGIARAQVRVNNLGQGKLTYSVPVVTTALTASVDSGVAPSTVTFTMEPGRAGVNRLAGTNVFTGAAGGNGAAINVTLNSREAVNFPPAIRLYMNFRQNDQRGVIYPVPTALNNNEGLKELLLDEARGRVYISNSGYNRIEVFDTRRLRFLEPIEAGALPRSMARSLDKSLLYVGNAGGESITVIDLDLRREIGSVEFPPIPRPGNQAVISPIALAMTQAGLQFLMSNGTLWRVLGNTAVPRAASPVISPNSATTTLAGGAQAQLAATPEGDYMLAINGAGTAYLYDAQADSFTTSRTINSNPIQSYYGPLAGAPKTSFFLANGLILGPALSVIGGAERPGTTQLNPPAAPGQPPTQTTVSAGQRHVASFYPIDEQNFVRLTLPVRQAINTVTRDDSRPTLELVNVRTGAEALAAVAPENPQFIALGTQRINVPARQMAVDSNGTVYVITLSGLSVIPMARSGAPVRPAIAAGSRGIVNANTGTTSFSPGAFITVSGTNLAAPATSDTLPLPTVLGGSCVTLSDVPLPLLQTSPGQITAQIPDTMRPGLYVAQVRSLAEASQSEAVLITVTKPQ
jgi:YVTN family beta-propeller protein